MSLTAAMEHFAAAEEAAAEPPAPEPTTARMPHSAPRPVPAGTRSPMTAYKNARQQHLGQMLTHLQQNAYPLVWRGEYHLPAGKTTTTALWWIALPGQVEQWYDTREAEHLVSGICLAVEIIWDPVAAPGGATQLAEALARMEQRRHAWRNGPEGAPFRPYGGRVRHDGSGPRHRFILRTSRGHE